MNKAMLYQKGELVATSNTFNVSMVREWLGGPNYSYHSRPTSEVTMIFDSIGDFNHRENFNVLIVTQLSYCSITSYTLKNCLLRPTIRVRPGEAHSFTCYQTIRPIAIR